MLFIIWYCGRLPRKELSIHPLIRVPCLVPADDACDERDGDKQHDRENRDDSDARNRMIEVKVMRNRPDNLIRQLQSVIQNCDHESDRQQKKGWRRRSSFSQIPSW